MCAIKTDMDEQIYVTALVMAFIENCLLYWAASRDWAQHATPLALVTSSFPEMGESVGPEFLKKT